MEEHSGTYVTGGSSDAKMASILSFLSTSQPSKATRESSSTPAWRYSLHSEDKNTGLLPCKIFIPEVDGVSAHLWCHPSHNNHLMVANIDPTLWYKEILMQMIDGVCKGGLAEQLLEKEFDELTEVVLLEVRVVWGVNKESYTIFAMGDPGSDEALRNILRIMTARGWKDHIWMEFEV
ncbi:hypothetical protein SBOR_7521 [Sclerotinia borealis F-4128]|uniref:Uncharacterized protein n=1 Tax=Sclerotinia borealis (strain F-4128) TaxID=1432307 RepID=W9C8C2_SCLBF|nr:hypothetical protein SBOR_7521 [Sclerotinia borealis F-4128]